LYAKTGFSGGKSNGTVLFTGNVSEKRNAFRVLPLFPFLPELTECHSIILRRHASTMLLDEIRGLFVEKFYPAPFGEKFLLVFP